MICHNTLYNRAFLFYPPFLSPFSLIISPLFYYVRSKYLKLARLLIPKYAGISFSFFFILYLLFFFSVYIYMEKRRREWAGRLQGKIITSGIPFFLNSFLFSPLFYPQRYPFTTIEVLLFFYFKFPFIFLLFYLLENATFVSRSWEFAF